VRVTVGRQLARYLIAGWAIGNVVLIVMMYVTYSTVSHDDWIIIISVACVTAGVFFNIYDVWRFEESQSQKNRGFGS